jgi:hypothetical protein
MGVAGSVIACLWLSSVEKRGSPRGREKIHIALDCTSRGEFPTPMAHAVPTPVPVLSCGLEHVLEKKSIPKRNIIDHIRTQPCARPERFRKGKK